MRRGRRVESVAGWLITGAVAGIGMAAGFTHTHDAAVRAGQDGWLAWADAVVIECMVICAGWQLLRARRAGHSIRFPASVLVVAFVMQMGAQVSGAPATFAGWLFAAVPALGCLVLVKLAIQSTQYEVGQQQSVDSVHVAAVRDVEPAAEIEASMSVSTMPNGAVSLTAVDTSWPPQQ